MWCEILPVWTVRRLSAIAEISPAAQERARKAYPGVHITADAMEVITSPDIDAIAVITPVWTHYELAKAALENGKHVFVEKPFTSNAAQGEEADRSGEQKNLQIMVDHTFLFTGAVKKISPAAETKERWGSSITTTRRASIWGCSSTTSTCFGIWRRTICRSWII